VIVVLLIAVFGAVSAESKVFYSRSEALELAFPNAETVESKTFVLDDAQLEQIEGLAKCELDSKLVKIYTAMRDGNVIGYALIDVHNVRTMPEAFMVVLNPTGEVRSLRVLAFHEPLEYKPTNRWYSQFDNKSIDARLRLGRDVHGVVGATLSARATTRGVRRALAYYQVLIQSEQ
jgi:Na+-translocating ferredoxin:NAD+ oxidoreductase RnfG subunit